MRFVRELSHVVAFSKVPEFFKWVVAIEAFSVPGVGTVFLTLKARLKADVVCLTVGGKNSNIGA